MGNSTLSLAVKCTLTPGRQYPGLSLAKIALTFTSRVYSPRQAVPRLPQNIYTLSPAESELSQLSSPKSPAG